MIESVCLPLGDVMVTETVLMELTNSTAATDLDVGLTGSVVQMALDVYPSDGSATGRLSAGMDPMRYLVLKKVSSFSY